MNNGNIYVGHRAVIVQRAIIPIRAVIAMARISETVVDAAIESNVRPPVARVPLIDVIVISPPRRRPERAHIRGHNPRAGNPVIVGIGISPIAWRPNVIVAGSRRLAVIGKRRRRLGGFHGLCVGSLIVVRWVISRGRCVTLTGRTHRSRRLGWRGRLIGGRQVPVGWITVTDFSRLGLRLVASCQAYE